MYNFEHETIPQLFPVSAASQLKPWFSLPMIDAGLHLIRERGITGFHTLRSATGALIEAGATVTMQFEKNSKLHQGFAIKSSHCGLCRRTSGEKGCVHLAALAILSLVTPAGKRKPLPAPLGFATSSWPKIGDFLHDWLSRARIAVERTENAGLCLWKIDGGDGSLEVAMPTSWDKLARQLLPQHACKKNKCDPDPECARLIEQLQVLSMTAGERTLIEAGSSSIGWRKDTSFWTWLARMLYLLHGDALPELQRTADRGHFVLRSGNEGEPGAAAIVLPREKTWEVVKALPFETKEANILPAALECYRLEFSSENNLIVSPCLRLADGRILSREDLTEQKFSNAYYLEGEGFLPTSPLPAEGTFTNPATPTSNAPLLGFLQNEQHKDASFAVEANDIPAFLAANQKPLYYPNNIVAREIREIRVRELPDRLFIDSYDEEQEWCYLSFRYGLGNTAVTLADIARARENNLDCLPGKEWLRLEDTPLSWLHHLAEERLAQDGSGRLRLSHRELLALTSVIGEVEIAVPQEAGHRKLADLLDMNRWTDDTLLPDIPGHLRGYQRHGMAWLHRLYQLGIGGLLADDMGLGKTHQGLALLEAASKNDDHASPSLVICPASVVLNWAEKIDRFYGELDYAVYYGSHRNLDEALGHGLLLTTYGVVRQELEPLRDCAFDIVLLDEIQHLKNRATAVHQAVAGITARVKIGLTGTPIENSLQDLRSLFDICLPGLLGSEKEFERLYARPISESGNPEARERLGRLIHPFILRRSRRQVLTELPEIIEDDRACDLSEDQVALYREVIEDRERELEALETESDAIPYLNILSTITRLKRICCHPCLVQGCNDPEEYGCGKWELFVELTEELLAADMKFVVFSQYTGMIELIETYLRQAGIGFASLKGEMAAGRRQRQIEAFNTDPNCRVFCASLLAGGVGIDLTGAQAVIHYDRWWNPAREEQATARVHRMGQKHVVQVFRLITRGTLEEKIHRLISSKRELANSLIQEDEVGIIKRLNRKQLAELLRFSPG